MSVLGECKVSRKPLIIGDLTAKIPLVQGGMGVGVSLSGLAGAVAKAGGVGIISTAQIGYREPDFDKNPIEVNLRTIKKEIDKAREKAAGGIIGVNIMVATKRYEDYVKAAVKAGVDLVVSGAGLPIKLPELTMGSNTKIAPIVSSVKSANVILKMWDKKYNRTADMVVIEGPKAGGHLGFKKEELDHIDELDYDKEILGIMDVVKEYAGKYKCHIPVVFGGGIYKKEDVDHYLDMGLDGVQVASRFVTTYECDADDKYKQTYINAKEDDIVIVNSPVGMPGRAIKNKFADNSRNGTYKPTRCRQCVSTCNPAETPYCITDALLNAVTGQVEDALLFCGANAYKAEKIEHVEDIIKEFFPE